MRRALPLLLAVTLPTPALAAQDPIASYDDLGALEGQTLIGCIGDAAKALPPEQNLAKCDLAVIKLEGWIDQPDRRRGDRVMADYLTYVVRFHQAGTLVAIDGRRSQRACEKVVEAFNGINGLEKGSVDAEVGKEIDQSADGMTASYEACGTDFPEPLK